EWAILRSDDNNVDFARYKAFIDTNPSWPSIGMFRRRAEQMLWHEKLDSEVVRAFFAAERPLTAKGKLAMARALLAKGDRNGASMLVRDTWRNDTFSGDLESQILDLFPGFVSAADTKVRMDRRLNVEDRETAARAAQRLGGNEMAIFRARAAVIQ